MKCDYCDNTGELPTLSNGETMCVDCQCRLPIDARACHGHKDQLARIETARPESEELTEADYQTWMRL